MDEIELIDKTIFCKRCEEPFVWSAGEQQFYLDKGLATPKNCPKCRKVRKLTIRQEQSQ